MPWTKYSGPKGGKGWINNETGDIRYQESMPDENTPSMPNSVKNATFVKSLGGSTGAKLVTQDGKHYVRKSGSSEGHVIEEDRADRIYRAFGANVPNSKLVEEDGRMHKISEYLPDLTFLHQMKGQERQEAIQELGSHFVLDALLANHDVGGMSEDNIAKDKKTGKVYRIDNGGSMRYRAQGAMKDGSSFGPKVVELETMRDPKRPAGKLYQHLSDADIADSIFELYSMREKLQKMLPESIRGIMTKRLNYMYMWALANR